MKYIKYINYLMLPLTIASVNVAYAGAKQVTLPFNNEPIFSEHHAGLVFNYDMGEKSTKKLVCELSYVYKGWLEFRDQGRLMESGVYGDADGVDTLYLTSKGERMEDQYHVDRMGTVRVNAVNHEKAPNAAASCRYEFDDNPLK